jgi:hypothetical protein
MSTPAAFLDARASTLIDDYVVDFAWSPDASQLAIAGGEGRVFLASLGPEASGKAALRATQLGEHMLGALSVAWQPRSDAFASSGQDGRNGRQIRGQNGGQERIEGRGNARRSNESRNLTYTCVVDTRQNRVVSGVYRYSGDVLRANERTDNRQLR